MTWLKLPSKTVSFCLCSNVSPSTVAHMHYIKVHLDKAKRKDESVIHQGKKCINEGGYTETLYNCLFVIKPSTS